MEPAEDVLVDAACWTRARASGVAARPGVNSLALYPETRELLRRGHGHREYRMTDPAIKPDDREVLELWGWRP